MADEDKGFIGNFVQSTVEGAKKLTGAIQEQIQPDTPPQSQLKVKAQSNYTHTTHQYPAQLGEGSRHPYFMEFYINVQELSKFTRFSNRTKDSDLISPILKDNFGRNVHSTVGIHQQGTRGLNKNFKFKDYKGQTLGFGRKAYRTATTIRLYMPDTLSFSYTNEYNDLKLSDTVLGFGSAVAGLAEPVLEAVQNGVGKGGLGALARNIAKQSDVKGIAGELAGATLLGDRAAGLAFVGMAINPQVDVIYQSPTLRQFNFEFVFAPRTPKEAASMQAIIKLFKFHASPEILAGGGVFGRYMVPPSEFDISFSVPTIGKISTCVLEDVTVDYGATGSAFYADNSPVHTRLTLRFRELEYITKDLIEQEGF